MCPAHDKGIVSAKVISLACRSQGATFQAVAAFVFRIWRHAAPRRRRGGGAARWRRAVSAGRGSGAARRHGGSVMAWAAGDAAARGAGGPPAGAAVGRNTQAVDAAMPWGRTVLAIDGGAPWCHGPRALPKVSTSFPHSAPVHPRRAGRANGACRSRQRRWRGATAGTRGRGWWPTVLMGLRAGGWSGGTGGGCGERRAAAELPARRARRRPRTGGGVDVHVDACPMAARATVGPASARFLAGARVGCHPPPWLTPRGWRQGHG